MVVLFQFSGALSGIRHQCGLLASSLSIESSGTRSLQLRWCAWIGRKSEMSTFVPGITPP